MKAIFKFAFAFVALLSFAACSDVPMPYEQPGTNNDDEPSTETVAKGTGTQTDPYNVTAALKVVSALASGEETETAIYVKGAVKEIKQIETAQYGNANYYITDDGNNEIYIFQSYYLGNRKFTADDKLVVGDTVVVYGKFTSNMPDGRPAGAPLAPGANPSYGAEKNGLLASLNSVAKLPYEYALDGISNTQTISPGALGHNDEERAQTLVGVLDGYFNQGSHHLNVNVFGIDKLKDAMEHPEKEEYQNFTIRVSGYAVKFIDLTREQQLDVIARQAHERL